jgi:hypothetical protein
MNQTAATSPRFSRPRATGWIVILAIFAVGAAFLAGLYITAWRNVPQDYRAARVGVPTRPLRLACRDFAFRPVDWRQATGELRPLDADFLLLTGLSRKDAHDLAAAAGMRHGGELQAFYSHGCAILARHKLHKGQVLAGSVDGACVVMAEPVIDGKRFLLACVHLPPASERSADTRSSRVTAMLAAWKKQGTPPLIVGGAFGGGVEAISAESLVPASPHFMTSSQWRMIKTEEALIEVSAH